MVEIAILEDELLIAWDLARTIEEAGFTVSSTSASAEAALLRIEADRIRGRHPDAAIIDIRLRGRLDGIDAAKRIREICGQDTPVIFLTGMLDSDTLSRVEALGAAAVLGKPARAAEIVDSLQRALHQHRAPRMSASASAREEPVPA